MVTGFQVAFARELQIRQRPLGEIADRLGISALTLDRALWRCSGIPTKNLRKYYGKLDVISEAVYPPSTGPVPG